MTPEADRFAALAAELPSHGRWVRTLARSLVLDEAAAEDLAQEVQLAALRRPGSIRGALAPWLARVTRNLARRAWRDAGVRARGERAAARPERLPAADDLCARIEIERRLVEAIAALEPALRRTLVRRYFDGWSAARIARESGEPASTVRWRLQRAIAELRARLDQGDARDGTEWRLGLLPLCGTPAPWSAVAEALRPAGVATLQGVLTMKASQALALTTAVAAAGLGVWWSAERDGSSRAVAATEQAQASSELEAPSRPAVALVVEPIAREPLPITSTLAAEKEAPLESVPPLVTGRCVDQQLAPIAGARVSQGDGRGRAETSATDGTFALPARATAWSTCLLVIEAEGYATRVLELPASMETTLLGDVVLQPGGSVLGRVLGPDGAPFGGAKVTVSAPGLSGSLAHARVAGPSGENLPSTISGEDGRFDIGGVATGPVRVWAGAEGMLHAVSAPVEVRARRTSAEVVLHLERMQRDDWIRGLVLSPEGEPVIGVRVSCTERSGSGTSTDVYESDGEGRFEVAVKSGCVYDFRASDGAARWPWVQAQGVLPGTQGLELRFRASGWIEVRVRDERGEAHEEFELLALASDRLDALAQAEGDSHPGGVARLRVPAEPFLLRVDARGFALAERGPFAPDEAPAELELELRPEPGVRGRVFSAGEPVAGARVTLHEAPPQQRIDHQGHATLVAPNEADETLTDDEGRFVLRLRERQFVVVRAQARGYAAGDRGPFEVLPETGRTDLELVLGRGGALAGRVLVAPGRDPAGVIVALNRGDGFPRTVRSDPEGRFGFEALTPGSWVLSRGRLDFNPDIGETVMWIAEGPEVLPFNCEIREGETTYRDLDLREFEPCTVAGVLEVNGAPAADWSVTAQPGAQPRVGEQPSTATAADGSFEFVIDEAGPLRLSFSWPPELGTSGRFDVLTEIHPGRNEWRQDFALGRIVGRARSWTSGARLTYRTSEGVEPACSMRLEPADDGSFVLPFVPAGKGSFQRWENGRPVPLTETVVVAGEERTLELP